MYQLKNRSRAALLGVLLCSSSCIFSQEALHVSGEDMAPTLDQSVAPDLDSPDLPPAPDMAVDPDMPALPDMSAPDLDPPDMPAPPDMEEPDASCEAETDRELCGQRTCGELKMTDSCGAERVVNCGECVPGAMCSRDNTCVRSCNPEDNITFCRRSGAACGELRGLDNCGDERTAQCGSCMTGGRCVDNQCSGAACISEDDSAFCARILRGGCGLATGMDNCGKPRCVPDCNPCLDAVSCCVNHTCQVQVNDVCAISVCPVASP